MPIGASVQLSGRVTAAQPGVVLSGSVETAGPRATIQGEISTARTESFDSDTVATGFRVTIDGEPVPGDDLLPTLRLTDDLDSHMAQAEFGLVGKPWSVLKTLKTWTKIAPIKIMLLTGPPGREREDLAFSGYLLPPTDQEANEEPLLRIRCGDNSVLFDRFELCHEVPPFSGLRRGEIVRELAADAGISQVDVPDGAVYDKPLVLANVRLFDALRAFGEPEGWHWRWRGEILEAFVPQIKNPPQAPDHVWHLDDLESLTLTTPSDPPSRYVVRGFGSLHVDEAGQTTEISRTTVESFYAPKAGIARQDTSGNIVPTGIDPALELLRTIAIIEDQTTRLGDKPIQQLTREWGWYNPAAGQLRTPNQGEPDGPAEGYHFVETWVDESGRFVTWVQERFVPVGQRFVTFHYDSEENLVQRDEQTCRYFRRTMGTKTADTEAWIPKVHVSDNQSYRSASVQVESYGYAERVVTDYQYDPASGAVLSETSATSSYYSPRVGLGQNNTYELFDGTAQRELIAIWRKISETQVINTLGEDGRLRGAVTIQQGYQASHRVGGSFDFGEFESSEPEERFRLLLRENTLYARLSENSYQETVIDGDGRRRTRVLEGRIPIPRYKTSPWTRLVQQPIELVLDDPVLERLFGFRRLVLNSEHIQNREEALLVATNAKRRATAIRVEVVRAETLAKPGDTVRLIALPSALDHRALLISRERSRNALTGEATGKYGLEIYL